MFIKKTTFFFFLSATSLGIGNAHLITWNEFVQNERVRGQKPNEYTFVEHVDKGFSAATDDEKKSSLEFVMDRLVRARTNEKNVDPDIAVHRQQHQKKIKGIHSKRNHDPSTDFFHKKEQVVLKFLHKAAYLWENDSEWAGGRKTQPWENILHKIVKMWEKAFKASKPVRIRDEKKANGSMSDVMTHFGIILQAMTADRFQLTDDKQAIYDFFHTTALYPALINLPKGVFNENSSKHDILYNDQLPFDAILNVVRPNFLKLWNETIELEKTEQQKAIENAKKIKDHAKEMGDVVKNDAKQDRDQLKNKAKEEAKALKKQAQLEADIKRKKAAADAAKKLADQNAKEEKERKETEADKKKTEEDKRKAAEEAKKLADQQKAEKERKEAEADKKKTEEDKRKAAEEAKKLADQQKAEKERKDAEAAKKKTEEDKRKAAEEAKKLAEQKLKEEKRKAEEAKKTGQATNNPATISALLLQKAAKISKKLEFNGDRKISDNLKNEIQGLINEIKDNLETITFDDVRRGLLTAQAEDFEETIGGAK